MRRQLVFSLALLFIALGAPSSAQNAGSGREERVVSVAEGAPLSVQCPLRVEQRAEWALDGGALPPDVRVADEAAPAGRLAARLHAPAARAHHAGVYTCARGGQRVRVRVLPLSGEAATEPSADGGAADAAGAAPAVHFYNVSSYLVLNCSVPRAAGAAAVYVWKKNDTLVETLPNMKDRIIEKGEVFKIRGQEEDYGNYSCSLGDASRSWEVRGRPFAKLPANTNVVEKQQLKLVCKLVGKPYPAVMWTRSNDSDAAASEVVEGAGVALGRSEQGVEGAVLTLAEAARADAGQYACVPLAPGAVPAATTLRVKDMYAALWPFLGICAEVFVLCAIILVYEKRRTKPELDDSDTDNHDQKKS